MCKIRRAWLTNRLAQYRVDERRGLFLSRSPYQFHGIVHGGMVGYAVQKTHLIYRHFEGDARLGVDSFYGPAGVSGDHEIEFAAAAQGSENDV
jgi:hypothetical protein